MIKIGKKASALISLALAVWVLVGNPEQASAADTKVFASVDRNEAEVGDPIVYTVSIASKNTVNVTEPRLPKLDGFSMSNSWSGSESRSTFASGVFQVEITRTFSYQLSPQTTGQLEIGATQVVVDGKSYSTEPIKITVKPASPGARTAPQAQAAPPGEDQEDPMDDMEQMFNQMLQRRGLPGFNGRQFGGQPQQPFNPNESFFIDVEVDKQKAYVGEQVTANWYLYTRAQIRDIDTLKYPSLSGFWKEEIELATRLNFEQHIINGIAYNRALLASYALFPIKTGTVEVDPYKAKCTVVTGDVFGFGKAYQFTRASRPVKIEVLPVPTEGRPKDFNGAVGEFKVSATLDHNEIPANQPVNLKIRFAGRGNGKLIDLPKLDLPPSVEIYSTKDESKFFKNGESYKEFDVLLIPREAGNIKIPGVQVSAFDPNKGKFYALSSPEIPLTVLPGTSQSAAASPMKVDTADAPEKTNEIGELILSERGRGAKPLLQTPTWLLIYLSILGILGWKARRELVSPSASQRLQNQIHKRIKMTQQKLSQNQWRQVGAESINLIYFVLNQLGRSEGEANIEKLLMAAPPSVRRELGDPIRKKLSELEAIAFAPEEVVGEWKEKAKLKSQVTEVERLIKKMLSLSADGEK